MIAATILLRRRGRSWFYLGPRWPANWASTLVLTLLSMVFFIVCTRFMALIANR